MKTAKTPQLQVMRFVNGFWEKQALTDVTAGWVVTRDETGREWPTLRDNDTWRLLPTADMLRRGDPRRRLRAFAKRHRLQIVLDPNTIRNTEQLFKPGIRPCLALVDPKQNYAYVVLHEAVTSDQLLLFGDNHYYSRAQSPASTQRDLRVATRELDFPPGFRLG